MSVILKKSPFPHISSQELAEQIEAKKKCKFKLPSWYKTEKIYYPNKLNIEQCSSELTAAYKAQIVGGKSLVDLTGGFGVDSFYFSKKIAHVFHCEINENISKIATYNFAILGVKNVEALSIDGFEFLQKSNKIYDWIFIDPSRRSDTKRKVFLLSDCTPNVIDHLEVLIKKAKHILLKTSPLLDISHGLNQLMNVKEVHIVAVNNEVKELLWVLRDGYKDEVKVKTINLKKDNVAVYEFNWAEEKKTSLITDKPHNYLYEPNAAILKSGAFKLIAKDYGLFKLSEHSHLYTSKELVEFPGRVFKIEKVTEYNNKVLKSLAGTKANISVRNFPENVANIRKRFKIKDGGADYVFFTTTGDKELKVIRCTKISTGVI